MKNKFFSILAISFCAGCGLFADEAIDVQPTEVVAPQEASASCCGKNLRNDEPLARCKNCGGKAKADESTLAGCGCKGGKCTEMACTECEEEVVEELACDKCNAEEKIAAELACVCGEEDEVVDALACCGHCDEAAPEEQEACS
jgi:hypothetical protein